MKKINIAGAGLSGLTAAINLALKGYKVRIFEKNKNCGERFNNDFQGLENWSSETDILEELRAMNININFYYEPFYKLKIFDSELNQKNINSKKPLFYLVKRGNDKDSIDSALKKQAESLGVEIIFNKRVEEKEVDIIATGPRRTDAIAKGITFNTDKQDNIAIGILNNNIAKKGYSYLLISKGEGTIATVLFDDFKSVNQYFEKTLEAFNKIINIKKINVKEFSGFGNFFLSKKYYDKGKLFTGERIGLQDYFLMFGMRYAITSGYLAAKSIIENKDYNYLINNRFREQLKTSKTNRFIFELLGNRGYKLLINRIKKEDTLSYMNKLYNDSIIKKILYPITLIKPKEK